MTTWNFDEFSVVFFVVVFSIWLKFSLYFSVRKLVYCCMFIMISHLINLTKNIKRWEKVWKILGKFTEVFLASTSHAGRAIPTETPWGPSGFPYNSHFSLVSGSTTSQIFFPPKFHTSNNSTFNLVFSQKNRSKIISKDSEKLRIIDMILDAGDRSTTPEYSQKIHRSECRKP